MKKPYYIKVHKRLSDFIEKNNQIRASLTVSLEPRLKRGHTGTIKKLPRSFLLFVPDGQTKDCFTLDLFRLGWLSIPSIGHYEGVIE
jgi:hypothetical protein